MKLFDISGYKRAARAYWFPLVTLGALTGLMSYQLIWNFDLVYVLLSIPVIAATYMICCTYFNSVNEQAREMVEMSRIHLATVEALATAIDAKDQTTHCHVRRVQIYAARMGRLMKLSENEIKALGAGALLHDIGKLAVPDHILSKPGNLTPAEFEKMKTHTEVGAQILERVGFPYPVVPVVRHHHEQWNGLGYPDGLRGEEIPLTARVFAVVDSFDTAREDRPYRRGMTREQASEMLRRDAGEKLEPRIVELFLKHLGSFEAEIAAVGLDQHGFTGEEYEPRELLEEDALLKQSGNQPATPLSAPPPDSPRAPLPPAWRRDTGQLPYLDQIRSAHREVYALYEIARTFTSSLDIKDAATVLVNKVGEVVPFDTCAVYLYDDAKRAATAAHVVGCNAPSLHGRTIISGEGVTGFVLANRTPVANFDPMLDFAATTLEPGCVYRSMLALPLVKNERLVGVLAVYSLAAGCYTDDDLRLLETVVRLASDALANAMLHAKSESNALTDALTGLPNARAMPMRFEQEASRARRTGRPFQVVMIDLDNFKQVNDTFGHNIGDQVLREAARILQSQLRDYDFLARYAGDEFVAIVQDLNPTQVEELHERIEKTIKELSVKVPSGGDARVGISIGAATYGAQGETLDQLLIAADEAMYCVKFDHKNERRAPAARAGRDRHPDRLASSSVN
ncbi:MAG: diguanylate cyclase [Acidobacteriota bacterium]|nr:diguanylate cyclase [Acidobacteriota bacterium]